MDIVIKHKKKYNDMDFIESNNNDENSIQDSIMKERREQLISKRKQFIQNFRNKQRLLSIIEAKNNNNYKNNDDLYIDSLEINDIEKEPDPISRIILLKKYLKSNSPTIDLKFINNNLILLKSMFSDFKKILFDYSTHNINDRIIINKSILYNYICLLFEPDLNPLISEFDFEFLTNINTFFIYYLNIENIFDKKENIIDLYIYILLFLNNIVRSYPDVELIKATIDLKKIIFTFYHKFFYFLNDNFFKNNNNNIKNNMNNNNNICTNLNICDNQYEFFVLAFLKLIENCIISLYLNDTDKKELIDIITKFIYYYYSNNDIKLLIYSLEALAYTDHAYLLLGNDAYNNFILYAIEQIIMNNNNNIYNELELTKIKIFFELYLKQLLFYVNYKDIIKSNINLNLYLKENIITFYKNYYFKFYESISSENKKEINIQVIKIIIKITKIFIFYFDLINEKNKSIISLEQMDGFKNILCSNFISKNNKGNSLFDILINTFYHFIKIDNKISQKLCNLIINIFNNIYPLKDIEYKTNNSYIKHFQLFLIEKYSLHMKLFPYLNLEKYPNLVLSIISLINKILFFCEQLDIYEKGNCFLEKIKKDLNDLNVFDEIENIESNYVNEDINFFSHFIIEQYLKNEI